MATLEENLQELSSLKESFKQKFVDKGMSLNDTQFRHYDDLIDSMEKIMPSQGKTIEPNTSEQVITADSGYKLAKVTVKAINTEEKTVKSTEETQIITASSGKYINKINVSPITLEERTISPAKTEQTILAADGYDGIKKVTVNAVTSSIDANIQEENIKEGVEILGKIGTYKGGVTPTGTLDIIANGNYDVTNYASANVNVEGGVEIETDTSATTAKVGDVLNGYDFYDKTGTKVSGTIQSMSGGTYTTNQVLQTKGKYLTSDIIVDVQNGNTRLENDTLYKMKSIDMMRAELLETSYYVLPTESEYVEQMQDIDSFLSDINANVTNFVDYALIGCTNELSKLLKLKKMTPLATSTLDDLVSMSAQIGTREYDDEIVKTFGVSDSTVTADKVLLGRTFYDSNGDRAKGTIETVVGRRVDINQTISTANKYIAANIEIDIPSDEKNSNETLNEMITLDLVRYNLGNQSYSELPTISEYEEQQTYVNNLIYEIQGVQI